MPPLQHLPELNYLSELYSQDAPDAVLLAEYPSSNSDQTALQNRTKWIIHDPFPPPRRELIKVLGPHHLMCGWGRQLAVTSELAPPDRLLGHWARQFGASGCPDWQPFELASTGNSDATQYITLFPQESVPSAQQVVDPNTNYAIHSKEIIANIDCPQADVLDQVIPPCIVKLSHGYAGLGNFLIREPNDEVRMRQQLDKHWPTATYVVNAIIENITGDFGVQFYLRRDGSMVWLGLTEQHFDQNRKWCGGTYSNNLQESLFDPLASFVEPVGELLHRRGYFGLVGIDILRNTAGQFFLVDVNPRLTGISPFLMASRIFAREDGLVEGVYRASCRFSGSLAQLIDTAESISAARVLVLSGFEDKINAVTVVTTCHLSVSSDSQDRNQQVLNEILDD